MMNPAFGHVPRYRELISPVFLVLKELGGSGTNQEIHDQIVIFLKLDSQIVEAPHLGSTSLSELMYQIAWAKTYLKKYGVIINSTRAVWSITPKYMGCEAIDAEKVIQFMNQNKSSVLQDNGSDNFVPVDEQNDKREENIIENEQLAPEVSSWRDKLAKVLLSMDPYGFERLAQRVLRECGFTQVEVTKKSGDGGIDGNGKLKINGIFSFNVAFQCKRYQGLVGVGAIRDFRGSLNTNVEKGVLITTGRFTEEAKKEASFIGRRQIDLIDGEELINKIAEYKIGVKEVIVYEIDEEFFDNI